MNVVIFEKEHFETAFTIIEVFDLPENKITVYTSQEMFDRLNDLCLNDIGRFNCEILAETNRFRSFFCLYKKLRKQKPDILWLNTISDNHMLWAIVLQFVRLRKIILTVHDINCLFESRFTFSFRKAIVHWGKKWLIKSTNEFNVISDTMISHLMKYVKRKKIHNIPGGVFENFYKNQMVERQIQIVVPGSIDQRRRNYEQVLELANIAEKEKIFLNIILLGGWSTQYGKEIIKRSNEVQSAFCQITTYQTKFVPQEEFNKQINMAHFVFIPSVIKTKICGDIPEEYGKTKSSGNIFDVIKHAKPFITPAALTVPANLDTSCFRYQNIIDITDFLKKIIASPGLYGQWQTNAVENSRQYTITRVREKNRELFTQPVS